MKKPRTMAGLGPDLGRFGIQKLHHAASAIHNHRVIRMRSYLSLAIAAIFVVAGSFNLANAQTARKAVEGANDVTDLAIGIQTASDIVTATFYGQEEVNDLCVAALGAHSPSLYTIPRIIPFASDVRAAMLDRCVEAFCAAGESSQPLAKSAFAQYCIK